MARKVKFDFVPSEYQEKFFEWIEHGVGNALIRAKAGSGKSSSAIASIKQRNVCSLLLINQLQTI